MSCLLGTAFNAPFVFCLVLAAATALAIASGDVDSPGAWAVVGDVLEQHVRVWLEPDRLGAAGGLGLLIHGL